jgi:hypothetical protein
MIKWEKVKFGTTDVENLIKKRMVNTHFSGSFGDIEIIEMNYCPTFTFSNLNI